MKNNKLTKRILSFVAAFALVFTISSCNQDLMETIYTPENNDVTFAISSSSYKLDGNPLAVTIQRGVAKEDLSVNLTLDDPNGVYTLSETTVNFAAGEYTKQVSLSYSVSDLKPVVNYNFVISFNAADKAAAGYNEFKGSAQMPLTYKDWGTIVAYKGTLFQFFGADQRTYNIQLAEFTNNYFKIVDFMGGGVDLEFNIDNGSLNITAPALTVCKYFPTYPMTQIPTVAKFNGGQLTCWIDSDPEYIAMGGLSEDGTLKVGSIIQFDTFWTTPSTYLSSGGNYWFKSQFAVTEVK